MFAAQADGRDVRTVEGLSQGGKRHPVQRAFEEAQAVQCGFCTAGFMMLAAGALERAPDMDDEALVELAAANLCRCTGYQPIVRALRTARDAMKGTGGAA